jgi:glycerophosphoryl diester phosphodiesterase
MFDLQGHRGARGLWPENTLRGFAAAIELGVCGIELDCAVTRDAVVVVTHDPQLSPEITRDSHGQFLTVTGPAIASLSLAQLQQYDVGRLRPGSAYAAQFPQQQGADGQHIPTLHEVLSLIRDRGQGAVRVSLELKTFPEQPGLSPAPEAFVKAVRTVVADTGTAAIVSILAFDWRVLAAAGELMPQSPRVALSEQQPGEDSIQAATPGASPWLAGMNIRDFDGSVPRMVRATGAGTWGPNFLDLDAQRVADAHALGLRVVPFTVNAREDMERMLELGVDGMISDRPDLLRGLLQQRGMPLPPARRAG